MTDETAAEAIRSLMANYIDLFSAGDFQTAVASYHLPFSWIVGPSIATAFTPEDFIRNMNAMRDGLVEKGFERSELVSCTVRMLGANAALVGVDVARHFGGGQPSETTGGTYIAHNDGSTWRLTSIIAHPVDEIVGR